MIKTVLIDDEKPALTKLQNLIKPYSGFEVSGVFSDAFEALEKISDISPQVAFIDIAMPGMNGLELANAIQGKISGKIYIVFVTAHEEYALPAFDVWATDYLLKPVSRARFDQTIQRIHSLFDIKPEDEPVSQLHRPMVHLFGKLELSGTKEKMDNWRTAKVRELFAFFLHNRNRSIYRDTLLETLWEDMSLNQALANMNTSNYYLRRHLEKSGADITLHYDSGYYSIDLGSVLCDADEFAKAEEEANKLSDKNLSSVLSSAALYRGRYFEDVKCTWADLEREHYASRYVRLRTLVAEYYLKNGMHNKALEQAMLGLEVNRLSNATWKVLLSVYEEIADPALLRRARENMRRAYLEHTGQEPPMEL
jgi:two-component SAPR family response regulator